MSTILTDDDKQFIKEMTDIYADEGEEFSFDDDFTAIDVSKQVRDSIIFATKKLDFKYNQLIDANKILKDRVLELEKQLKDARSKPCKSCESMKKKLKKLLAD